ncbi:hypothetical protein Nepgr_026977 [Nepenthes gracilis]|uniref:Uncharacterized protein n=1 Tax=Nepenthes gracilis TaxID=150966 RepID=A0AAD3T9E0_NEPGR|nr:hypothetical protein Nepgr_026977 [Nepenthes gracilis]
MILGLSLPRQISQKPTGSSSILQIYSWNQSILSTLENSVAEQARANNLKSFEIGLIMKKLQLKETQLALNSNSNFLERCKLFIGISKASLDTEKFKTRVEDARYVELLRKCVDGLVAGLRVMSASLAYGACLFIQKNC